MKLISIFIAFIAFSFGPRSACSAQPPQWVGDLASQVFTFGISQISHWEEKEMTWFNVNGMEDGSDSVTVNTLYVEGVTSAGQIFIGAIPESNQQLTPLGSRGIKTQTCTSECGCQCCKFKRNDYGCFCDTGGDNCCVEQTGCKCWCRHTLSL